ncbi:MAG TPA: Rrf2 family transcriptional regulator [Acidobacteriota bacterium]|jgi:Rrf2 family protein|nr:Rrf2 family transcriptional regulator [Acidobacteriota bacterium]
MQLLSLEGDYALRSIIYLACQPSEKITYVSEIAREQLIPINFLFKILRKLVKRDLVKSFRGPNGGYMLARSPSEITFLEVIEAIDGPVVVNRCLSEATRCLLEPSCKMLNAWQRIQEHITDELTSLTISDLLKPAKVGAGKSAAS